MHWPGLRLVRGGLYVLPGLDYFVLQCGYLQDRALGHAVAFASEMLTANKVLAEGCTY